MPGRRGIGTVIVLLLSLGVFVCLSVLTVEGQSVAAASSVPGRQGASSNDVQAEAELQRGVDLTSRGRFQEAIPHLLQARQARIGDEYAADFNLALCYVATGQNEEAILILRSLLNAGHGTAAVYNLQAQALLGVSGPQQALEAFQRSADLDPKNEKLYLFLADSSMDYHTYDFGLRVVGVGLQHLPKSARLHYERGILLSFVDQPDEARVDLKLASELAPGTTISFLAEAQAGLLDANMPAAVRAARNGLQKEPADYVLLTILGKALIREGVSPGQAEFDEAQTALEKAAAAHPDYAVCQLALGELYLIANRLNEAIAELEKARRLAPDNPSVYSLLGAAYRRAGSLQDAEKMFAVLAGLNREQAARYKLDPPDHKGSYIGSRRQ
ncbi:MAG: tetratricopeptide repeat protein [Candidatus Acidiferrales bacterium]